MTIVRVDRDAHRDPRVLGRRAPEEGSAEGVEHVAREAHRVRGILDGVHEHGEVGAPEVRERVRLGEARGDPLGAVAKQAVVGPAPAAVTVAFKDREPDEREHSLFFLDPAHGLLEASRELVAVEQTGDRRPLATGEIV